MASIVGEKYRYAEAGVNAEVKRSGWIIPDKIFEYLDKAGDIYNKIRYPQPGDPDYVEAEAKLRLQSTGMFGLPRPFGFLLFAGAVTAAGVVIYRIATKK